jgi:tetratricopeptide (TPR) repeat protein
VRRKTASASRGRHFRDGGKPVAVEPSSASPSWLLGLALFAAAAAAYVPAMRAGFVWDDDYFVDYTLRGTKASGRLARAGDGLYRIWFTTEPMDASWVQWRLWGPEPAGYHVVNILLHALAAVLIWRILRRLGIGCAFAAALIFAVHPLTAASAAWISELKNTLSLALCAAALLCYLRFDDGAGHGWYASALALFALALTAKTSVVTLPILLLICAWWRRGRIGRGDILRSAAFFLLSIAMGAATIHFQQRGAPGEPLGAGAILSRLAAAGWIIWFYIYKALLPVRLCMIYPKWEVSATAVLSWLPLAAVIACFAVLWRFRRSWARAALMGFGWFVVTLLPVLGILAMAFMKFSLVSDHLLYPALPAVVCLAVAGVGRLLGRLGRRGVWISAGAAAAVVITFFVLTWRRAAVFDSHVSLWRDNLEKNPTAWVAHFNLGVAAMGEEKWEEAEGHYRRALRYRPEYFDARMNLGLVLVGRGKPKEAIEQYHKALEIKKDSPALYSNLGLAYAKLGKLDEAVKNYRKALQIEPDMAVAHRNFALALAWCCELDGAIEHLRQAVRSDPQAAEARRDLKLAIETRHRLDEEIDRLRRRLSYEPDSAKVHFELGLALVKRGRLERAAEHLVVSVRLNSHHVAAAENLAWLLATEPQLPRRDSAEAVRLAELACRLTGRRDAGCLEVLSVAYAAAGQFEQAQAAAQEAINVARPAEREDVARRIGERLKLYKAGRACHEMERPLPPGRP